MLNMSSHHCKLKNKDEVYFLYEEIAIFRLKYVDDYEYGFSILSTRFRFGGRNFSKCACSKLKSRTGGLPRSPF